MSDRREQPVCLGWLWNEGDAAKLRAHGLGAEARGSDDDYRNAFQLRSPDLFGAEIPTVHDRHHEIQKHRARAQSRLKRIEGNAPILRHRYSIAFGFEQIGERRSHIVVVIDDQYGFDSVIFDRFHRRSRGALELLARSTAYS